MDVKTKEEKKECCIGDGWVDLWTLDLYSLTGSLTIVQEVMIILGQHRRLGLIQGSTLC